MEFNYNIRPYIVLNGINSQTIPGLIISKLPPISKPLQRTLVETVDGRDGDIMFVIRNGQRYKLNVITRQQAIEKYGALKGGLLAAWRLLRCNPFSHGGYDPVP